MDDIVLMNALLSEEKKAFCGWDFSYLNGRWKSEPLSWDYRHLVDKYRCDTDHLLDMGTGGGEFILKLGHPFHLISVTEGWQPNLKLCKARLAPLGITIKYVGEEEKLEYPNEAFDLVMNRHASFDISEVYRVLKPGGYFITQQVGEYNDRELIEKLLGPIPLSFPGHNLKNNLTLLQNEGFEILGRAEEMPQMRFFDLGAVVYFAKQITWEFCDFSVNKCFEQIKALRDELDQKGYIANREHRFLIIAQKNNGDGSRRRFNHR